METLSVFFTAKRGVRVLMAWQQETQTLRVVDSFLPHFATLPSVLMRMREN
jgi:hypothetical protein